MKFQQFLESQGTYVGVKVDEASSQWLQELQRTLRLQNPLELEKFHSTVLYSRKHLDVPATATVYDGRAYKVENWKTQSGKYAVVVKVKSPGLTDRHNGLIEAGGTHDYPTYQPHITISYDDELKFPLSFEQPIKFVDEYVEPLDLEWK